MWRHISHQIVERAAIYNRIQRIVGSRRIWDSLVQTLHSDIKAMGPKDTWLDLGCGTAEFLAFLPEHISYIGIDNNPKYIQHAKVRYRNRPNSLFICGDWSEASQNLTDLYNIKIISLLGLLHHLNDREARDVLTLGQQLLSSKGTLFSLDGCPEPDSSIFERFFYWVDRGNYIRTEPQIKTLFPTSVQTEIHPNWLVVPYRYVVCTMRLS